MSSDLGSRLVTKREERVAEVVRRLLEGDQACNLRPELEEIDAYSRPISAKPAALTCASRRIPGAVRRRRITVPPRIETRTVEHTARRHVSTAPCGVMHLQATTPALRRSPARGPPQTTIRRGHA